MTLKINLTPGECVVIGKARVENGGDRRCTLIVSGSETILRQKRLMRERDAATPMKRLYFVVQCMYLADSREARESLIPLYQQISREAAAVWPQQALAIVQVGELLMDGNDYGALNQVHALVEHEQRLLDPEAKDAPA